jgi:hypothetical protein
MIKLQSYDSFHSSTLNNNNNSTLLPHVFDTPVDRLDHYTTFDPAENSFKGAISFRPSRPGSYRIFMINTETKQLISKIHRVKIQVRLLFLTMDLNVMWTDM